MYDSAIITHFKQAGNHAQEKAKLRKDRKIKNTHSACTSASRQRAQKTVKSKLFFQLW